MSNESDKPEVRDIDCLEAFDYLYAYLNNEIANHVELANIEHHLSHCKSCYSRAQMERKIDQRMKENGKDKTPSSLQNRLRSIMDDL
jgi:anti-sigma factor (TIGR02949 family)